MPIRCCASCKILAVSMLESLKGTWNYYQKTMKKHINFSQIQCRHAPDFYLDGSFYARLQWSFINIQKLELLQGTVSCFYWNNKILCPKAPKHIVLGLALVNINLFWLVLIPGYWGWWNLMISNSIWQDILQLVCVILVCRMTWKRELPLSKR